MYRRLASLIAGLVLLAQALVASPLAAEVPAHRVSGLRITVLSTMLADGDAIGEWGYAALVEVDGRKLLFDAGLYPETVLRNAKALKIDLSGVEDVVISHNHDDHVGGLVTLRRALMARNPRALSRVHVGAGIFDPRVGPHGSEGNGLLRVKAAYERLGGRFVVHDGPVELLPGVWFTGPVPRPHPETNWDPGLQLRVAGGTRPDIIREDSSLVFATDKGMVLLTGCGHAGIVNIAEDGEAITGLHRIAAIVGGLHLFAKSDEVIRWTAGALRRFEPAALLLGHCTGIEATYMLRQLLALDRRHAVVSAVGSAFDIDRGISPGAIAA